MSYNPTRQAGKKNHRKRQRNYNPHAGVKHSDIMRRRGVGRHATTSERINTRHGYTSDVFSCEGFSQRYACLYAGNSTGIGFSESGDRTVRVMSGTLYVTFLTKEQIIDDEGNSTVKDNREIQTVQEGQTVNFPAGTKYALASSGTADVELLVTETTGYGNDWQELEDAAVTTPESITVVPPRQADTPRRRPREESKAYQQAQHMGGKRGKAQAAARAETVRRSNNDNVNSSTFVGVNPRPSGPPTDD